MDLSTKGLTEMTIDQLRTELQRQLILLDRMDFPPRAFRVWSVDDALIAQIGDALVRIERNGWSWGRCQDQQCSHNSHDPYSEGDLIYINAIRITGEEDGSGLFALPNGTILEYRYADHGRHFAPTAWLGLA